MSKQEREMRGKKKGAFPGENSSVIPLGLEPKTLSLKVRCSTS